MALIAVCVEPEWGIIQSTFPLMECLRDLGHTVVYWTEPSFERLVVEGGFECITHENQVQQARRAVARHLPRASRGMRARLLRRLLVRKEAVTISKLEAWLRVRSPAVVLIGLLNWPHAIAALRCGIPVVKLNATFVTPFGLAGPPAVFKYVPSRIRPWRTMMHAILWARVACMRQVLRIVGPPANPAWGDKILTHEVRQLGGRLRMTEYGPTLDVPEFIALPRALEYPFLESNENQWYLGLGSDRGQQRDSEPQWIDSDSTRPLVYCSFGTLLSDSPKVHMFLVKLIQAVRCLPVRLIISLGAEPSAKAFENAPENVVIASWLPQREVLARADLFISHCGTASIRDAIAGGVPVLAFPHHGEQYGTSSRIVFHQIGIRGYYDATAEQIGAWIRECLSGPYANNTRRLRDRCLADAELTSAVMAFEAQLRRHR